MVKEEDKGSRKKLFKTKSVTEEKEEATKKVEVVMENDGEGEDI